jgi:hypothetical protein
MNKKQMSSLHSSLKESFKAVKDDITKLKKRDVVLKDEISETKKHIPNLVTRDDFFGYVKKIDEQMEKAVGVESLKKAEEKLSQEISLLRTGFNSDLTGLKDRMDTSDSKFSADLDSMKKDFNAKIEDLKSELKKTDDLKKEVREVRSFKKQVADLEKTYAKKKQLDECFEEQDEIYDLIEELEEKVLKKKDVEAYQKLVDDKLRKYRDQMDEVERIADKFNLKLKEIDDSERQIKLLTETMEKVSSNVQKIDKSDKIKSLELNVKDGKNAIRAFEKKVNEVISIVNEDREQEISKMTADSFYQEAEVEEIEATEKIEFPKADVKVPEPKIFKAKKETVKETLVVPEVSEDSEEERKGFFGRIVDWFFEEVPEDEEDEVVEAKAEVKTEAKAEKPKSVKDDAKAPKETKKESSKKETKKSEPKREAKKEEPKVEDKEEPASEEPEKKGFFGRIVEWFLEEEEDDEEDLPPKKE